jgi:hypothetical protein
MIEITRSLARQLSSVLRRCYRKPFHSGVPVVEFAAGAEGLHVRVVNGEVAAEYRQAGTYRPAKIALPLDALAAMQGRDEGVVILESGSASQTVARWQDAGVPQAMAFVVPEPNTRPAFPESPETFVRNTKELLTALDTAARTVANDSTRYALQRLQLRGKSGQVVGTDSKQLFIQGGFDFGFEEDLLVPRALAFGCPELGSAEAIEIGRTKSSVAIRVGAWTIALAIDTDGQYPQVDEVIPKSARSTAVCRFSPDDAEFLVRSLPRLPGKDDFNQPVTVDLNGHVAVRAKSADQPQTTEIELSRSEYTGHAVRLNLNRDNLIRALQLGFRELAVVNADTPLVCRDGDRTYVMMPLSKSDALPATDDPLRIRTDSIDRPMKIFKPKQRTTTAMNTPSSNGSVNGHDAAPRQLKAGTAETNRIGMATLIADAEALKDALRLSYDRAGRLCASLKRNRKQSRLVASTLASLKQLQTIDG